jgi:transcriptional regulator with PAS, ATPase and Fis domain
MSPQELKQRFGIIGQDPALDRALFKAMQVAATDISVMVTGESGVGKESIPRVVHNLSHRKHESMISVNCGAIPEGTMDSELFGHEKGSFTGAVGARKGYFEAADGGTIFLDEVGELPLATQVRLLRVLETGEIIRVGSSKAMKVDVRVVAATNVDLAEKIEAGKFREDLFYRLNTVEITLPPLRERKGDIYLLFRKFAQDFSQKYRTPAVRLTEAAVTVLESYRWPGNIRQLRNLVEQISVIEGDQTVEASLLSQYIPDIEQSNLPARTSGPVSQDQFHNEREILYKVLFDMRADIQNLKHLVGQIAQGGQSMDDLSDGIQNLGNKMQHDITTLPALWKQPEQKESPATSAATEEAKPAQSYMDIESLDGDSSVKRAFKTLENIEIEMIKDSIARHKGRRKEASAELGISERTLYRKIKQYDLG